ncbi:MAG TPA: MFS transporter [Candidatus Elarobacter sp.]|nr:MFS transporter [Candidatus Elarobacter sp.]
MKAWLLRTEAPRPTRIRDNPHAHWFVVATVCIGAFMGQLDASIVTVALPTLQRSFGADIAAVEWVALSYLIVLVSLVAPIGRLADMAGRKMLYLIGFAVFVAGSALCALSPSLLVLDAARVSQAVGAAMLQANSVALIAHAMPPGKLGRGLGVQAAAQAVGLALGPSVGGALLQVGDWRTIFWINVPVGIVALVLGWVLLPRSRDLADDTPFDWTGTLLFVPAIACGLGALSFAGASETGTTTVAVLAVGAVAFFLTFVWWERRSAHPFVDLALLADRAFSLGLVAALLAYATTFGTLFVVPFFLERALGIGPGAAGLQLTALPVALGVAAPAAGYLADHLGLRRLTTSGMALVVAGLLLLVLERNDTALRVVALALIGAGLGAFTPANNSAIMRAAPRQQSGAAGGVLNMTRGLGTSLGVALCGTIYAFAQQHVAQPHGQSGFVATVIALAILAALAAVAALARSVRNQAFSSR